MKLKQLASNMTELESLQGEILFTGTFKECVNEGQRLKFYSGIICENCEREYKESEAYALRNGNTACPYCMEDI